MLQQRYHSRCTVLDNTAVTDRMPLTPRAGFSNRWICSLYAALNLNELPTYCPHIMNFAEKYTRRLSCAGTQRCQKCKQQSEKIKQIKEDVKLCFGAASRGYHLFKDKCCASAQLCHTLLLTS